MAMVVMISQSVYLHGPDSSLYFLDEEFQMVSQSNAVAMRTELHKSMTPKEGLLDHQAATEP